MSRISAKRFHNWQRPSVLYMTLTGTVMGLLCGLTGSHAAAAMRDIPPPPPETSLFMPVTLQEMLSDAWEQGRHRPQTPEEPPAAPTRPVAEAPQSPVVVHGLLEIDSSWVAWTQENKLDSTADSRGKPEYNLHNRVSAAADTGEPKPAQALISVSDEGQLVNPQALPEPLTR